MSYHNHSQYGYRLDDIGRKIYGQPGIGGCGENAPLRYVMCEACAHEFGTYYRVQLYCDDRCRAKAKYLRKKTARERIAPVEHDIAPLPRMSLEEVERAIASRQAALRIHERETDFSGQATQTGEEILGSIGIYTGNQKKAAKPVDERPLCPTCQGDGEVEEGSTLVLCTTCTGDGRL